MDTKTEKAWTTYEKQQGGGLAANLVDPKDVFIAGYNWGFVDGEREGAREAAAEVRDRYGAAFYEAWR